MASAAQRRDDLIIASLISHSTVRAAAAAAGLGETAVYNRLRNSAFRERYAKARRGLLEQATSYLAGEISASIDVLKAVRDDPQTPAQTRINASEYILRYSLKLVEQTDVLAQLADLEAQLEKIRTDRG